MYMQVIFPVHATWPVDPLLLNLIIVRLTSRVAQPIWAGGPRFNSRQREGRFLLYVTASKSIPGTLYVGEKRPG